MEFYYLADGSAVGTYNGMPYNFHPEAIPIEWAWFLVEVESGMAVEVDPPAPIEPPPENPVTREMMWQSSEMAVIANQLLAIEEEADDALPGSRSQWLSYRTKVRLWHEAASFPDISKRPGRPS